MTATPAAPHLCEDLLTPRFYTTEIEKAARTPIEGQRAEFEAMLGEMKADYNREHFDRKAPLGRLKDLSRRLGKAGRPELGELFQLMARDEARHAGFLNRALVAEDITIDLPSLSTKRPITWFALSWVLYSVYLSEKIGYWRYILIDRHLKTNPDNNFAPLFWSVFLTHSLTVCERGNFYRILGMDPNLFDAEVMRQTNRTARRAFPAVFDLESSAFIALRDRIVDTFRELRQARGLRRLGLNLRFGTLLLRQFCQPMVATGVERAGAAGAELQEVVA